MEDKEIVYPLKVKIQLWDKFKEKIPRKKTINDALIELIEKEIK